MGPDRAALLQARMLEAARGDSAHDGQHVERVLRTALKLAEEETDVDLDLLTAACLLHDIGRPIQNADPTRSHAREGASLAQAFLLENGWDEDFARRAADCIRTHSFRANDPPVSLEARLLFDADKLDVCGALGVARTLLFQGRAGLPLYETDEQGRPVREAPESGETFFSEVERKLRKVHSGMYTKAGAREARRRLAALEDFTRALWEEIQ